MRSDTYTEHELLLF